MRAIAVATISVGLVQIPVRVYAAVESRNEIHFRLLHRRCLTPLKQRHACESCDIANVDRADVLRGYETAKDRFLTFEDEELEQLGAGDQPANQTIAVEYFVHDGTPLAYYVEHVEKTYFVGPDAGSERPFAAFAKAMDATGLAAIGKYTTRGRTHLIAIGVVQGDCLEMVQLRPATEVRSIADVPMYERVEPSAHTVALAKKLIQSMTRDTIDFDHVDVAREQLENLIRDKEAAAGGELEATLRASLKPKRRARRAVPGTP